MHRVQFFKGVVRPHRYFYSLREAENISRFAVQYGLLLAVTFFLFLLKGAFGIGTETLSEQLTASPSTELAVKKFYIMLGHGISGIAIMLLFTLFLSLLYWVLSEVRYKQAVIVMGVAFVPILIETLLHWPLGAWFGLGWSSSPFGLGVLAQEFTDREWVVSIFGSWTVFKGWSIVLQYYGFKDLLDEMRGRVLIAVIVSINIAYWAIAGVLKFVDFTLIL
ncbi:hypothetical protein Q75_16165 [Bacillus coahuilensis p1.1.43]|uniref:Yip1 domain-containing protein n=1 Tax=Bacillus coahuilensis p1.1.43 TaxID=1150625 RepID=A0A147K459_9BACI|nr:YIP1 family protein [Bacillus coahuilensis]KUP04123.1 hypothetical protein Q75_16165 [Bacillus coahuilensis p1.1.43]